MGDTEQDLDKDGTSAQSTGDTEQDDHEGNYR